MTLVSSCEGCNCSLFTPYLKSLHVPTIDFHIPYLVGRIILNVNKAVKLNSHDHFVLYHDSIFLHSVLQDCYRDYHMASLCTMNRL